MDSLTHTLAGVAIGQAAGGKSHGRRAMAVGLAAGLLPDVDVLLMPFLSPENVLWHHRGATHSFFVLALTAPLWGWLAARWLERTKKPSRAGFKLWTLVFLVGTLSHVMLDILTVYGTQAFWPFTREAIAIPALFIIDPLLTFPLLFGVIAALMRPKGSGGKIGLSISLAYLVLAVGLKVVHLNHVGNELDRQGIAYDRFSTASGPLTPIIHNVKVATGDTIWVGNTGLFDTDRTLRLSPISRNTQALNGWKDTPSGEVLTWFANGWYRAEPIAPDKLAFIVLKFGRSDLWLTPSAGFIFVYHLTRDASGKVSMEQVREPFEAGQAFALLWRRIQGEPLLPRTDGLTSPEPRSVSFSPASP